MLLPRTGAAVHVNAFNFPVWGLMPRRRLARCWRELPVIDEAGHEQCDARGASRGGLIVVEAGFLPEQGALLS